MSLSDAEAGELSLLLEWGLLLPSLGVHQWAVALILILTWLLLSVAGWCMLSLSLGSVDGHHQWCIDGLVVLT